MCKEGWCVGLGQEGLSEGGGKYLKYIKRSGTEKRGGETNIS